MSDLEQIAARACYEFHASQHPSELRWVLELVKASHPSVIVEIGCDAGGTLWAWKQLCDRVYGITLSDNGYDAGGSGRSLRTHGAEVFVGDSHSLTSRDWLREQLGEDEIDVLVIDGDHTVAGVWEDIYCYAHKVRTGGLILMHDILVRTDPRAEVWRVWDEIREAAAAGAGMGFTEEIEGPYGWGVIHVREYGP